MVGEGVTGGVVVGIVRASTQVLRFLITKESALNRLVSALLLLQRMASLRKLSVSSPFVGTVFWRVGGAEMICFRNVVDSRFLSYFVQQSGFASI